MNRSNLLKRIRILESKADQMVLQDFLGDEYYKKYMLLKNSISDDEYKNIYKLVKKKPSEVKDYIDRIESKNSRRKQAKRSGAKLVYEDDLWKVYHITTYDAAVLYGKGTKWCISGNYSDDPDHSGEEYFNVYIERFNLDGYYFYIHKNGKKKYCLLTTKYGEIESLFNERNEDLFPEAILDIQPDFPSIMGVFVP